MRVFFTADDTLDLTTIETTRMSLWTRFVGPRTIVGVSLFAIPIAAAGLPVAAVDLIVPRGERQISQYVQDIAILPKFGAEVAAAFYNLAVAAAVLAVLCLATGYFCLHWITKSWSKFNAIERFWTRVGTMVAVLLPLTILTIDHMRSRDGARGCKKTGIDDCVATALFDHTINATDYQADFMFKWDVDVLAYAVLSIYLLAALTIVIVANMEWLPAEQDARAKEFNARRYTMSVVLFLMAAVLVATMVVVRFRFDIGLATFGGAPTATAPDPSYTAYQTIASGLMVFWSSVLSIWLALIYVPSAYVMGERESGSDDFNFGKLFDFNPQSSTFQFLRAAAILSPPMINKIIEVLSSAPKVS